MPEQGCRFPLKPTVEWSGVACPKWEADYDPKRALGLAMGSTGVSISPFATSVEEKTLRILPRALLTIFLLVSVLC